MRCSQGIVAAVCRLLWGCGALGALMAAGCSAGGNTAAPVTTEPAALSASATHEGSRFNVAVLPDSFFGGARAEAASLELHAVGAELTATVSLAGARGLKALYASLGYDAARWHPVAYEALGGFADNERTLSLSYFDTPGEAQAGVVLRHWQRQRGLSGDFSALRLRFARGADHSASAVSLPQATIVHLPLTWNGADYTLNWYFVNPGDYNQNGIVGLTDLTPLAQHWGESATGGSFPLPSVLSQIDGNSNGSIEIGDLTTLGVNWNKSALAGCHVYHSTDAADYPADSLSAPVDEELLIATVPTSTGIGGPADRKHFAYELSALTPGEHYWVRPNDGVNDLVATTMCTIPIEGRGDWWMWGREPLHQRRSAVNGPQHGELAWKFDSNGPGTAFSSPLVGPDGSVYAVGGGKVYALEPDNSVRWTCQLAARPGPPALGSDGKVYVTSADNSLYAIMQNGAVAWHYAAPDTIYSGACVGGNDLIYFGCADDKLYAINPDGTLAWAYDRGMSISATPVADFDGNVYVVDLLGVIAAVSASGVEQWTYDTGDYIEGPLALGPGGEVYVSLTDRLVALAADGSYAWAYNPPGSASPAPPAVREDGMVLVGADSGLLYAINPTGSVAWSYDTAEALYDAPAVSNLGVIAVITRPGKLVVLTANGADLWSANVGAYSGSTPAIGSAGQVYAGGARQLFAFDSAGAQLWVHNAGGEFVCNPAIDADGTVYAPCLDGNLYALNPDGTVRWTFPSSGTASWASPALRVDGTVLQPFGDRLIALSSEGVYLWEFNAGGDIHSSPAIDAMGYIYFGCSDNKVYALNPDGTLKWSYTAGGDLSISSPALWTDGTLYIGSAYQTGGSNIDGKLYAIDSAGELKWAYDSGSPIWSSPLLLDDGRIVFGTVDSAEVLALYPAGTLDWSYALDYFVQGSAALGLDGTIYIGDRDSNLYALTPDGVLSWRNKLGGPCSPCIGADGTLYSGGFSEFGIFGLDPQTGEKLWSVLTGNCVVASPSIGADGTLYCGASDCSLYAIRDP